MKLSSPNLLKRSSQVSLVLLGTLTLTSCERTNTYEYRSQQDCEKDWGEEDCKEHGQRRMGGYFFYASANRHRATDAKHARHVQRGGFGSRFSSGRS